MPKKPQYAKRAKILKYVKVGDKWRFANVVEQRGKPVRDHVLVSGVDEHHPEGTYYIEWYEIGGHRRRQAVDNFALLLEEARLKALHMEALRAGVIQAVAPAAPVPPPLPPVPSNRLRVETAIDKYLEFIENHRSPNTHNLHRVPQREAS
jgi:integrase/recombinase XerD